MKREFNIIIEQDEDGYYIASVPELPGCHTQAKSLDKLNERIIEAIELYIEVDKKKLEKTSKFFGIQKVELTFEET
jgi:predicted RNase H-like HicB family nuclease